MRTGYENGYQVITLTDCTAATSVAEHENAITYDYPMFSKRNDRRRADRRVRLSHRPPGRP
jgi:nicotinamidase-related amidase